MIISRKVSNQLESGSTNNLMMLILISAMYIHINIIMSIIVLKYMAMKLNVTFLIFCKMQDMKFKQEFIDNLICRVFAILKAVEIPIFGNSI